MGQIFQEVFFNTEITKVFHAPQQDLKVMHAYYDELVQANMATPGPGTRTIEPVHDTQVAAQLLECIEHCPSYEALVESTLGIELPKSPHITRSNWKKRPLTSEQLQYAYNDARYLYQAFPKQVTALKEKKRLKWSRALCTELVEQYHYPNGSNREKLTPALAWKTVKAKHKHWLTEGVVSIAGASDERFPYVRNFRAIAAWREVTAKKMDKPRSWVMDDKSLLFLACSDDPLAACGQVPDSKMFTAEKLRSALQNSLPSFYRSFDKKKFSPLEGVKLSRKQMQERDDLMVAIFDELSPRCEELGVSKEVVVTKRTLTDFLNNGPRSPEADALLNSWRKEVFGDIVAKHASPFFAAHFSPC